MNFTIPSSYELLFKEELKDVKGTGISLRHKRTGARVALVVNDDDNKVFSIGFRTPPVNSTGVAHIIEHSVLCGSRKFPVKDPFVELAKGSLNTFLNAMTYPDKTVYPVASMNMQDFKNLMDVYMDAVLHPNIYQNKEIFYQEGWHYELENEDAELTYNGVVYNEMKGAFSSPESQLYRLILNSMFPDTAYGVESGGDPDNIPALTYEEFMEFHKTYYHPSNSYIYLYGDMDFEERLNWLDSEYLSKYDQIEVDSEIKEQKAFSVMREVEDFFSLGEDEEAKENTYLSLNGVIGNALDKELGLTFQILDYVLLQAPGAPIKQALLDAQIGKDIFGGYDDGILQPSFSVIAKNAEEDKKEQFVSTIMEVLTKIAAEGIEEKSLRAAINFFEFRYREADYGSYPKGLMYGLRMLSSWLYDEKQPFIHMKDNEGYDFLKEKIGTGYYEQVIKDYLLNNTHTSLVILKPKAGLGTEKEEKLKAKLAAYKATLSKEEIADIVLETAKLKEYQDAVSTKEELELLPLLSRNDIDKKILPLCNEEHMAEDIKCLYHNVYTNGIVYLQLIFDIKEIPKELLPFASLLAYILGYVDTENYTYLDLSNEENIHTGGIETNVKSFAIKNTADLYSPVFEFSSKVLYHELSDLFRIINEMLYRTKFDDTKRLKEIIDEIKSKLQMHYTSAGHSVAVDRALSYSSANAMFKEITSGITFYKFIEDLVDNFTDKAQDTIDKMKNLMQMIFAKNNLFISITSDEEGFKCFENTLPAFSKELQQKVDTSLFEGYDKSALQPECLNEGFKTAMQVQYVARTGNFIKAGFRYTGALRVLQTILSFDYLWMNLRVKGGAYGCMCGFSSMNGNSYFVSFRDPNLAETNAIYEKTSEFVKNFNAEERDITKYIIGTFSSLDSPLSPRAKGIRSLNMYYAGITEEDLQKERDEVLNITIEDIRSLDKIIQSIMDAGNICVIGNENKIEENKELFKEVKMLFRNGKNHNIEISE